MKRKRVEPKTVGWKWIFKCKGFIIKILKRRMLMFSSFF